MRRPRGVALVSVLLIVAVVTTLAYRMASRHSFSLAQSRLTLDGSQARQYALGGEQFARGVLQADWEDAQTRDKDTLLERWAGAEPDDDATGSAAKASDKPSPRDFAIEDGDIQIHIADLTARFNLNAVAGPDSAPNVVRMKRLLTHLELNPDAADAWRDYLDEDQEVQDFGAEDADFLLRTPPRRTADQRAYHVSEFMMVASLTAEEFARLRPFVTVLPVFDSPVNVNTATDVVIGSLAPNFTPDEAQEMFASPRDFGDVETVIATYAPLGASADALSVSSEFFRIQVRAEVGDARSELTSLVHRDRVNGTLTLLSRSFGERFEAPAMAVEDPQSALDSTAGGFHAET